MNSRKVRQPLSVLSRGIGMHMHTRSLWRVVLILSLPLLCGCEQDAPRPALATFPAKGKIVTTGRMPVGGCVQFEPAQNGADYVANGVIQEDGQFTLRVPYIDRVLPGATEGPHTVRVLLPLNQGGTPVPVPGTFVVKPQENEFTIEMPSAPAG